MIGGAALAAAAAAAALSAAAMVAEPPTPTPALAGSGCGGSAQPVDWPLWEHYLGHFVSGDGRVIDRTDHDRSTSEGQAYALFFALVADDRAHFDRVLGWTRDNLARGDLRRHLPAWKWGRDAHQAWRVLDANSASDADVWLGYALLEAGRLWGEPRYEALGRAVLEQVRARAVATLPQLGPMLLPAPVGFELARGTLWRLNPSYLPPPLLRRFGAAGVPGPWEEILESTARMLRESTPAGLVADWVAYRKGSGFGVDPVSGPVGSYDAIRVYLWGALMPASDPLRPVWTEATRGLLARYRELVEVPERVDVARGRVERGPGPPGFAAVLRLLALGAQDAASVAALEAELASADVDGLYGQPPHYYDQNLILFALGFSEGRYRFGADGRLLPAWEGACAGQ